VNPFDVLGAVLKDGKVGLVKSLAGDYDAVAVRSKMDSLVKKNPVLMFSFTTCPFCKEAKAVLDAKGAKYTVVELDEEDDGKAIRAEMGDMLGRTSVPAIWIKGTYIGGCNDGPLGGINTLNSKNELDGMLKKHGQSEVMEGTNLGRNTLPAVWHLRHLKKPCDESLASA
jgi:glutaredoxin 3